MGHTVMKNLHECRWTSMQLSHSGCIPANALRDPARSALLQKARWVIAATVLQNARAHCEELVPGPALAIDIRPGLSCFSSKFSSSNFSP